MSLPPFTIKASKYENMKIKKYENAKKEDRGSHHELAYHDHKDVKGDIPFWPPNQGNDLFYN